MKQCCRCKTLQDISNFSKDSTKRDGLQMTCKACQKEVGAKYRANNPNYFKTKNKERYHSTGKLENKERYEKYKTDYLRRRDDELKSVRGRLYVIFSGARERARRGGREFALTLDWVMELWVLQDGKCAVTGLPLTLDRNPNGERFYNPFNPSLDRIDATVGYTKENTRLVSVVVNLSMNIFGDSVFDRMCAAYIEKRNLNQP